MKSNDRLDALLILENLFQNKKNLSVQLAKKQYSAFTKELCFGFCRQYFRLQLIKQQLVKKSPKPLNINLVILLGLYQLLFNDKPDYAVVQATVELLVPIKQTWAKGLVNAVLRNFIRQQADIMAKLSINTVYQQGHPEWLVNLIKNQWPKESLEIIKANDVHPPLTLRINQQKISQEKYINQLLAANIDTVPLAYSKVGVQLSSPCDVGDLPGFKEGQMSVQDQAAQHAALLLQLKPGLRVLDACCAPGGKLAHILEQEPKLSDCLGLDIDALKMVRVADNLKRLNLTARLKAADVLDTDAWYEGVLFDRILLDAPCSASGIIRRHPDIKILRTAKDIEILTLTQKNLLEALWPLLAPGGLLLYATCSIFKQENEQQIARFVDTYLDSQVIEKDYSWGQWRQYGWQILPGHGNQDGFFYSLLMKKITKLPSYQNF